MWTAHPAPLRHNSPRGTKSHTGGLRNYFESEESQNAFVDCWVNAANTFSQKVHNFSITEKVENVYVNTSSVRETTAIFLFPQR